MAVLRLVGLGTLAAAVALAQINFRCIGPGTQGIAPFAVPSPVFDWSADPPLPEVNIAAGHSEGDHLPGQASGHRFFYDAANRVYFGYDFQIQPDQQPGAYSVTFFDLAIGPPDFAAVSQGVVNPAEWKKLPLPDLPPPQSVRAGDVLSVAVFVNSANGQKLVDAMRVQEARQGACFTFGAVQTSPGLPRRAAQVYRYVTTGTARDAPTVSGTARDFSVEDAELRLAQVRVKINGQPQELPGALRAANGSLVWFYLPNRGRFILSLAPRSELGFRKAGEVRGGVVTLTLGKDEFTLESPTPIASGDAPYVLYVLHDADWEPTAQGQAGLLLIGTVSPREVALTRK